MPLLKVADRYVDPKPLCLYAFPKEHKGLWQEFWCALDGDHDKVLDFAKKAGIENPVEWLEELHKFLFDLFVGCPDLVKKASKDDFGTFIGRVLERHLSDPKDKHWYITRGVTYDLFIKYLKDAKELEKPSDIIKCLNGKIRFLGDDFYSEFLLLKTKQTSDIKSLASDLTKQAYEIELDVIGESNHPVLQHATTIGNKVAHKLFDGEVFTIYDLNQTETVVRIGSEKKTVVSDRRYTVVDSKGKPHILEDVWNFIPINAFGDNLDKLKKIIYHSKAGIKHYDAMRDALFNAVKTNNNEDIKYFAKILEIPLSIFGM